LRPLQAPQPPFQPPQVSAAEEAKKHVRASLAAAKAEKRSVRRQDNVKQETSEIAKMQSIKADFNTTRFKRLAKEDQVKKLMLELESVGGEMEDDVNMLESCLPQRDQLETAAVTQEVSPIKSAGRHSGRYYSTQCTDIPQQTGAHHPI
jgi:uncharacterized protein (DUF3084 family)